jgi:L-lactate dehydrogenase complex protein LldG
MATDERSSKEKILKKVRAALLQKGDAYTANIDLDTDVFTKEIGELIEVFSGNFLANSGQFAYCFNEYDFIDQFLAVAEENEWQHIVCLEKRFQKLFDNCDFPVLEKKENVLEAEVGITGCEALVARTGSIVISTKSTHSRTSSIYPPTHIVIAYRNNLVYDLKNYFSTINPAQLQALPSMINILSGPSRTSDIEKTLVLGAHGPKELFVFYIDQENTIEQQ